MQNGTYVRNGDVSCFNKASDTITSIFSFENLYNSYLKCTNGVKWKQTTQEFMFNAWYRVAQIYKSIQDNTYKMENMHFFSLMERGKVRNISALSLKDRIVHKCLCENYLTPLLSKSLIYDSGATIKNKGILFAKNRIIAHLQQHWRKYGNNGYVLRVDFKSYFESINHEILFKMLRKRIKNTDLYNLCVKMIPNNVKGLGLGSQISQICAMYYVNSIDHFCKEKLHLRFYSRYMDDICVISNSKRELKNTLKIITKMAKDLKLTINKNKTKIYTLKNGFTFCKCRYKLTKTGKVLKFITSKSFKSMKRKVKKHSFDLSNIIPSWQSYINWFDSFNKFRNFIYFVNTNKKLYTV